MYRVNNWNEINILLIYLAFYLYQNNCNAMYIEQKFKNLIPSKDKKIIKFIGKLALWNYFWLLTVNTGIVLQFCRKVKPKEDDPARYSPPENYKK